MPKSFLSFPFFFFLICFCATSLHLPQCAAEISSNSRHHLEAETIGGIPKFGPSPPEFGHNNDENEGGESTELRIRAKRHYESRTWTSQQIIEAILCVFLPPLAVIIHGGHDMLLHLLLNVILWICGWVPGAIHAFWYCFYH